MTLHYEILTNPPDEITRIIEAGLHEFNLSVLGPEVIYNYAKLVIISRDDEGAIQGGLLGAFLWGALKIDTLWVDRSQREQGSGTRLLQMAEAAARQRDVSLMYLETTSFQAREFYEENGFSVYGQLENYPAGHTWFHMKKQI